MEAATYVEHLKVLQNIREIAGGQALNLPQICVVGDQSSGKSSLLKLVTGVDFPVNSGTCTKAAIVVECKKGEESHYAIQNIESKIYDQCEYDEVAPNILKVQRSLLINSSCSKISDVEIKVKVTGPDMIDIIVVDLPGIINVGEGASETRSLIKQYIKPEESLILLVSEAKQDKELITADELTSEFDPSGMRTMHVYTKFDTFDTKDSKYRAIDWINAQRSMMLGGHAVIAAPGGGAYDSSEEFEQLSDLGLPSDRVGISALKTRLPAIFSKLIATNLPGLNATIEAKVRSARSDLQKIGAKPMDSMFMIKLCQDILLKKHSTYQSIISPFMEKFRKEIRGIKSKITKEWTTEKFPPNIFVCPFFSGNDAFRECVAQITEWWQPILVNYTEEIDKVILDIPSHLKIGHAAISETLYHTICMYWKLFCQDLLEQFKSSCHDNLGKFRDFGTVNHYLTSKYQAELHVPKKLVKEFIESINSSDFEYIDGEDTISVEDTKKALETKLENVRMNYEKKFQEMSLHEQQQHRLHAAVLAAYSVEEKTFVDLIFKQSINLLDKVQDWVINSLMTNEEIRKSAFEDEATSLKRESLQDTLDKMNRCLKEISKIM